MFVDSTDLEELGDAKLARMHPKAYEAKMKAREDGGLMKDLANLLRGLFAKKAK
jgi:hypothetical protein